MSERNLVAFDPGYGAIKVFWEGGSLQIPSAVAVDGGRRVARMAGLKVQRPPLEVVLPEGRFYVGERAHDWGRPVENMDLDRLFGTPEMRALFFGAMTRAGIEGEVDLVIGVPVGVFTGPEAEDAIRAVKTTWRGTWRWVSEGRERWLEVREVLVTGQPVGALMDYFLNLEGRPVPERRVEFPKEIGILNIGMNTIDLMTARNGELVQRLTAGETLGVRRLLALLNPDGLYTLAELDDRLRRKDLDPRSVLPLWEREVFGFIERQWGGSWRRFARILAVGGGVVLLKEALLHRFQGKAFIPDDPILATARGLYKIGRARLRRE